MVNFISLREKSRRGESTRCQSTFKRRLLQLGALHVCCQWSWFLCRLCCCWYRDWLRCSACFLWICPSISHCGWSLHHPYSKTRIGSLSCFQGAPPISTNCAPAPGHRVLLPGIPSCCQREMRGVITTGAMLGDERSFSTLLTPQAPLSVFSVSLAFSILGCTSISIWILWIGAMDAWPHGIRLHNALQEVRQEQAFILPCPTWSFGQALIGTVGTDPASRTVPDGY